MEFIFNYFIHQELRGNTNTDIHAKLILVSSLMISTLFLLYAFLYYWVGYGNVSLLIIVCIIVAILCAFVLKANRSMFIIGNVIIVVILLPHIVIAYYSGGLHATNLAWLCIIPLLATMLNGIRTGLAWGIVASILVIMYYMLQMLGYTFSVMEISDIAQNTITLFLQLGLLFFIMVYSLFYEFDKNQWSAKSLRHSPQTFADSFSSPVVDSMSYDNETNKMSVLHHSMTDVLEAMEHLSQGDLTIQIEINEHDESMYDLANGFNAIVAGTRKIIQQIKQSIEEINDSTTQITYTSQEMSVSVHEQSNQAKAVVEAVGQTLHMVATNAQTAIGVAEVAMNSNEAARNSEDVVKKTVDKIWEISQAMENSADTVTQLAETNREVGIIVGVIKDIAHQSKLLALNAAIEAAHAGHHGKGFAVVAGEVRKLAQNTSQATKQIASMIDRMQTQTNEAIQAMKTGAIKVEEGIDLSAKTGEALKQIVSETALAMDMMRAMAESNESQTGTVQKVAHHIQEISIIADQSVGDVEQIVQSAISLHNMTENVRDLVLHFHVN